MLPKRDDFLAALTNETLAICGLYLGNDAIHVGIFWYSENEKKVVHFQNGNYIPVENVSENQFENYLFNPIPEFPTSLLPSLSALSELISQNLLNGFTFNRIGVVYNGGKFEYQSGIYTTQSTAEKYVNCAVFVIALLNTYNHQLIDWASWPNTDPANRAFLDNWLAINNIPAANKDSYYNQAKEVRGKHVLVSPSTTTKPSPFPEAQALAEELIIALNP